MGTAGIGSVSISVCIMKSSLIIIKVINPWRGLKRQLENNCWAGSGTISMFVIDLKTAVRVVESLEYDGLYFILKVCVK